MNDDRERPRVEDMIITGELDRRPSRAPDHEAENRALRDLAEAMAAEPSKVLQRLAEAAMALTGSGSAGVSLLQPGGEHGTFRWVAAAGAFAENLGSTLPREASPCGEVIARKQVLLLREPGRVYPSSFEVGAEVHETLLAPFNIDGEPAGTVWAVKHSPEGRFEREDARILDSLARCAAAAHQMVRALGNAREAGRRSEELRRIALDGGRMGAWQWDVRSRLVRGDAEFQALYGVIPSDEPLPTEAYTSLMTPESAAAVEAVAAKGTAPGEEFDGELEIAAGPAAGRWVRWRGRAEGDRPWVINGVSFDVTERLRERDRLRESEERLRLVGRATNDAVMDWDLGAGRMVWNEAIRTAFGYADAALDQPAEWWTERIHPDDRARMLGELDGVLAGAAEQWACEYRFRLASGRYAEVVDRCIILRDEGTGAARRVIGSLLDVSAVRSAEAALRESEKRLALAFKTLPVGIAIVDATGETVTANNEMRRFLPTGRIPSRDPGRSARWRGWDANGEVVQPENFPGARALRGEGVFPGMQMLYQDDNGAEVWTEVLSAPLQGGDGRINGAITVVIDVNRLKRSEEAAQASEERLRQFGEASLDVLWIRDAETLQWTYLTPAFEAIYGLSREEVLTGDNYRGWQDLIVPEDRAHAVASINRVRAGERVTFEYRVRRPADGQVRWLRNTDFPMRDGAGRVTRIGGVGHDVTALKAVEAAVAVNEERLRLALDIGRLATWDWDMATGGVVWNDAHYRMQGYEPGEVRPSFEAWRERLHPDDVEPTIAAVEQARDRREEYVREFRNLLPDGTVRWTSARGRFFHDGQGRPTRMIGVMEDVTDRLEAEHALAASEARLRTLMEGIPQLVWRSDDGGLWTWASPQWTMFTGQAQGESHGLGWLGAVHPDDREAAMRAREAARPHGLLDTEHRIRRASDGAWLWHHTRSVPVRDAGGRIVEWLGTSTDVQQLKGLQERQAVMVAELQHRTRNLIAVARSIAGQTMARTGPTEAFREEFNHRLEALARVQGLLSRSDEEPITIEALIRMELDALGLKNGLAGRVAFGGPPARIRHSVVQTLALALHELATNARKHGALSTDAGRLDVRWQVRGEDGQGRRLLLDWTEEGGPPPDTSAAARRGYGRELIERALPYALDARTRYELDGAGVRCTIDMPLEKARSRRSSP